MKKIRKAILTGLLVVLPTVITIYVVYVLFNFFDSQANKYIKQYLDINVPGLGILVTVILLFVTGLLFNNFLGSKLIKYYEKVLSKIPIVKTIYISIKEIIMKFTDKKHFSKVVLVNFPNKDTKSIGFVSNEYVHKDGHRELVVFIPTTPNPTNGFLVIVKEESVIEVDVSVEKALRQVVSMGTLIDENSFDILDEIKSNRE